MEEGTVKAVQETAAQAASAGVFRLAHALGIVLYAGGLLTLSRLLGGIVRAEPAARQAAAGAARRVYLGLVFPALLMLLTAGIYMLIADPDELRYLKQPYMHIKLTVVLLVLIVDHMLVMRPLKSLAKGDVDPKGQEGLYRAGFWMLALLFVVILYALYIVRR